MTEWIKLEEKKRRMKDRELKERRKQNGKEKGEGKGWIKAECIKWKKLKEGKEKKEIKKEILKGK